MKLKNTKQYYKDLAHYYFADGKVHLMTFFRTLVADGEKGKHRFSKEDNYDWFETFGHQRPQRDEDNNYV